jgi:hypothetical protein
VKARINCDEIKFYSSEVPNTQVLLLTITANKYKSPCGAEGEEKARYPQGHDDEHCNYVAHEASCTQPETSQKRINGMNRIAQRICNHLCLVRSETIISIARTAVKISVKGR